MRMREISKTKSSVTKNTNVPLEFQMIDLQESQITSYAKKYFECHNIEQSHGKFISNIKRFSKINEAKEAKDIESFINLIQKVDSAKTIKVGDQFSVLEFEIIFAYKEINCRGFTEPKEVANIKLHSDGTINYIQFTDGDIYPRLTPARYKGKPVSYAAYFNDQLSAEQALIALTLAVPDGWDLDSSDIKQDVTESRYSNFGFDIRSDYLWPATLLESSKSTSDLYTWIDEQRAAQNVPESESTCILSMILHVGDEIAVIYGPAKYVDQTDTHYVLKIPSGTHQYSKKNQMVFDSSKSFEKFLMSLTLKFGDIKINVTNMPVMEATVDKKFDDMLSQITRSVISQTDKQKQRDTIISIADTLCNHYLNKCQYECLSDRDLEFISREAQTNVYTVMSILGRKGNLSELSTEKLAQYKRAAGADASAADARGDFERGHKRFKGIVKATLKQFDQTTKPKKDVTEDKTLDENLRQWFKEKWVRFNPQGKIMGSCARGDDSEGKPKCLPQAKAHALGKKGRASAASRKRREDPNPERSGKAINVATKKQTNESIVEEKCPHCSGPMFSELLINEKKDACYYKVKSRYKVWPSAYASGALVKCRKVGAKNWGNKSKANEAFDTDILAQQLNLVAPKNLPGTKGRVHRIQDEPEEQPKRSAVGIPKFSAAKTKDSEKKISRVRNTVKPSDYMQRAMNLIIRPVDIDDL